MRAERGVPLTLTHFLSEEVTVSTSADASRSEREFTMSRVCLVIELIKQGIDLDEIDFIHQGNLKVVDATFNVLFNHFIAGTNLRLQTSYSDLAMTLNLQHLCSFLLFLFSTAKLTRSHSSPLQPISPGSFSRNHSCALSSFDAKAEICTDVFDAQCSSDRALADMREVESGKSLLLLGICSILESRFLLILEEADTITYFRTILGILRAGFIMFSISLLNGQAAVEDLLRHTKAALLFMSSDHSDRSLHSINADAVVVALQTPDDTSPAFSMRV
ncbi:hypothetical protein A0H81_14990 [Grifola frondosa]|uniref:Uncharacterized protein n=1 Tax=Grifola frondosa TaxID=5627 RepID=A0A1C7LLG6_GRIFR|nr:hypothetical protein A0H81_14990 [Grifola frondosa]